MHGDYPTRLVCTGMHTGDEDWSLLMVAIFRLCSVLQWIVFYALSFIF